MVMEFKNTHLPKPVAPTTGFAFFTGTVAAGDNLTLAGKGRVFGQLTQKMLRQ